MIEVACTCGKTYKISEEVLGKKAKCRQCGREFRLTDSGRLQVGSQRLPKIRPKSQRAPKKEPFSIFDDAEAISRETARKPGVSGATKSPFRLTPNTRTWHAGGVETYVGFVLIMCAQIMVTSMVIRAFTGSGRHLDFIDYSGSLAATLGWSIWALAIWGLALGIRKPLQAVAVFPVLFIGFPVSIPGYLVARWILKSRMPPKVWWI